MSSLVVVTLNMLHGPPLPAARVARGSVMDRLERVGDELAAASPDIVLLQEASRSARHGNTAALLARRLGMDWTYAAANPAWLWRLGSAAKRFLPDLEFEEGPAILSRLPILDRHVHRLSSHPSAFERRIALEAILGGPRGPFSVFSVHLTAVSQAERRRQIGTLLRAVGSAPHHHPSIVGGDFNAEERTHEMRLLTEARGWIDSFREVHPEAPGYTCGQALSAATATAGKRIDFLFSVPAGAERWQPSGARLILDTSFPATSNGVLWASDHYGVLAHFDIAAPSARPRPRESATAGAVAVARDGRRRGPSGLLEWRLPAPQRKHALDAIAAATARPPESDWQRLPDLVRARFPSGIRAIVGYGSWFAGNLRKPMSFPDVYLVVDDYERFHASRLRARANRWLPPDVQFVWEDGSTRHRPAGKFNAIDAAGLARECGPRLHDVYNVGRLSKLVWIAWTESEALRSWLVERLLDANRTATAIVMGLLPVHFSLETFSLELLAVSYRGEARLEGWERIRALRGVHADFYDELHPLLLDGFAAATGLLERDGDVYTKRADPAWRDHERLARRLLKRSRRRGYLRWARILLGEPHLVDLAANEAERKAGVEIRVTPHLRRHPLLLGLPEFLRVLRKRNTRDRIHGRR